MWLGEVGKSRFSPCSLSKKILDFLDELENDHRKMDGEHSKTRD